jgi:hypothetical protein
MQRAFNARLHPEKIPGHHRALRYLTAADSILLRACEAHLHPARSPTQAATHFTPAHE